MDLYSRLIFLSCLLIAFFIDALKIFPPLQKMEAFYITRMVICIVAFFASLFLFIVTANLMGQLPLKIFELKQGEIASPTNDINLTAGLAVIVLVYYVVAGVIKKKHKFLLHEISFVGIISMLVEILELVTRPLTLALRLFGNILAGEILITALLGLIAWGLPLPIMFFEILVACVQALVFTMLTTVYIATAVNENH